MLECTLFKKLFPVLSDHLFSEGVSPQSSASTEASSRDGLISDALTGHPRVAVQIERKDVLDFTLNIHPKKQKGKKNACYLAQKQISYTI